MIKQYNKGPLCIAAAAFCWSLGGLCFQFIPVRFRLRWGCTMIKLCVSKHPPLRGHPLF